MTRLLHAFADHAVGSEVLATIGTVTRWTRDPRPNPHVSETVTVDLMERVPSDQFDLALLHPRCTDESDMTSISGDPGEHKNQIPRAREIAEQVAEDYIIENKPRDDLQGSTVLHGRMFGLPLAYERAFETTFPVRHPARHQTLGQKTVTPYFYSDRTREWWAATKGYHGDYPKQHLAKNALPAAYVRCLIRSWLESLDTRDAEVPKDNNTRPPPKIFADQATLPQTNGGRNGRSVDTDTDDDLRTDGGTDLREAPREVNDLPPSKIICDACGYSWTAKASIPCPECDSISVTPRSLHTDTDDDLRTDGGRFTDGTDRSPSWICTGCKKITSSQPMATCQDCGGHFRAATVDDASCDRCGDPDGLRLLDRTGEFDRLCNGCIRELGLRDSGAESA